MDDDKKATKSLEIETIILIILVVVIAAGPAILVYLHPLAAPVAAFTDHYWPLIVAWTKSAIGVAVGISFPISAFFLIGIIYATERLKHIRHLEAERYDKKVEPAFEKAPEGDHTLAHRWESAQRHIEGANENDWKQAILEADTILDDLLTKMGYQGTSIGEKLKRVQPGEMKTLDDAWEAHKVRNRIAHDGSAFHINQHEAKQILHRYKKVFEEFYYL